jgi:hypothetical protein
VSGSINDTIGNLRYLRSLSLRNNHLRCQIPDSMSKLVALRILHLGNNQLHGKVVARTNLFLVVLLAARTQNHTHVF